MSERSHVRVEPPDVCVLTFVGDLSADEVRRVFGERAQLVEGWSHAFLLVDLSRVGSVPSAARKAIADTSGNLNVLAAAMFGASFPIRALATVVSKAVTLLRNRGHIEQAYFAD